MQQEESYREVLSMIEAGQHEDALQLITNMLRGRLGDALLFVLATTLWQLDRGDDAIGVLLFTLSLFPDHEPAKKLLAEIGQFEGGKKTALVIEDDEILPAADDEILLDSVAELISMGKITAPKVPLHYEHSEDAPPSWHMHEVNDAMLLSAFGIPVWNENIVLTDGFIAEPREQVPRIVAASKGILQKHGHARFDLLPCSTGSFLSLVGKWSLAFWHWFMERLPIVVVAEQSGFSGTYIIPQGAPFIRESLHLLAIPDSRILEFDGTFLRVETLCLPERTPAGVCGYYPGLLKIMRERLLTRLGITDAQKGLRRIYLSRNDRSDRARRVSNEEALLKLIAPYRFETIYMESLSLKEQISLMAQAEALITPHGAGMVHTLFMPPQSLVLEMFSPSYVNPCMLPAMKLLDHRYFMVPMYVNGKSGQGEDIEANINAIEVTLKRELNENST